MRQGDSSKELKKIYIFLFIFKHAISFSSDCHDWGSRHSSFTVHASGDEQRLTATAGELHHYPWWRTHHTSVLVALVVACGVWRRSRWSLYKILERNSFNEKEVLPNVNKEIDSEETINTYKVTTSKTVSQPPSFMWSVTAECLRLFVGIHCEHQDDDVVMNVLKNVCWAFSELFQKSLRNQFCRAEDTKTKGRL